MKKKEAEVLLSEREQLYQEIEVHRKRIQEIEDLTFLSEMEHLDHYQGTNCEEWQCIKCKTVFVSPNRAACPKCHKFEEG